MRLLENIQIPKEFKFGWSGKEENLKKLDPNGLLVAHNRSVIHSLYSMFEELTQGVPYQLIQVDPIGLYKWGQEYFSVSDVFSFQDRIPYNYIGVGTCPLGDDRWKSEAKNIFSDPDAVIEKSRKKSLSIDGKLMLPGTVSDEEIQGLANSVLMPDYIPIIFSEITMDDQFRKFFNLVGLHIHNYSNHLLTNNYEHNATVHEANMLRGASEVEKQKAMLSKIYKGISFPDVEIHHLYDPCDSLNSNLIFINNK